jgi:hypothetical protein
MNKKEVIEKNHEIASRVKGKGDTWEVYGVDKIQTSLTDALESYYNVAIIKPKSFRLNLVEGKLYAILTDEIDIKEPEPKKYSIYGEYIVE